MLRYLRKSPYRELERALGYSFSKRSRLEAALTHRSFRFENEDLLEDNQRMEFLGDAILGFVIAEHLYERFQDKDEGFLTTLRSQTTSGKVLAEVADELDIGRFMRMGKGEEHSGGRRRPSTLADAMEAVIAAAYFDGGWRAVGRIFKTVFLPRIEALSGDVWEDNPKGRLQEFCQRKWKSGPRYHVLGKEGPAHEAEFKVEVQLPDGSYGVGRGRNKRDAETDAATDALKYHRVIRSHPGHGNASGHGGHDDPADEDD